ncbi:hypothetical protein [Streptomyces sp. H27-H5]|uniref:hypothetical protein n=1 Tax=Streptomyces sp. H27-H5 TaxID=2996460 RepID=UPI002271EAF9|nr:hypothetical protein [Streptomyces sp. H27-H5]MCY0962455.1 hypothetical protein [Streptomyces sp. H27-H5]
MSSFADPGFDTPDEFDLIMREVAPLTAFAALFDEAEELLAATRPGGFDIEEIGRLAFEELPESEKAAALDELFYTYWSARELERDARPWRREAGESRG